MFFVFGVFFLSLEFCWSLGLGLSFGVSLSFFWSPLLFDELHAYEVDIYIFLFFSFSFARLPLNSFLLPGLFSQNYGCRLFLSPNFVIPSLLLPLAVPSPIILSLVSFPPCFFLLCDSQTAGSFSMSQQLTEGKPRGILVP